MLLVLDFDAVMLVRSVRNLGIVTYSGVSMWTQRRKDRVGLFFASDSPHPSIGHQTGYSMARRTDGVDRTALRQHDNRRSTRSATSVRAK